MKVNTGSTVVLTEHRHNTSVKNKHASENRSFVVASRRILGHYWYTQTVNAARLQRWKNKKVLSPTGLSEHSTSKLFHFFSCHQHKLIQDQGQSEWGREDRDAPCRSRLIPLVSLLRTLFQHPLTMRALEKQGVRGLVLMCDDQSLFITYPEWMTFDILCSRAPSVC